MAVPISQVITVAKYAISNTLKGKKRYPLVMMLEPLFQCNLACSGCGKIQYPKEILAKRMPKEKPGRPPKNAERRLSALQAENRSSTRKCRK